MRKIKNTLMFVALFTVLSGFIISNEWQQFETSDFQALFPQSPTSQTRKINSASGELKMAIYLHDASKGKADDNLVYAVSITEYPNTHINSITKENLPNLFKNAIDGAVTNVNGKLLSESTIQLDGYPGREIKIDFKDGLAIIKMRIYLVKNEVYMIQTITKTANDFNKSIDKFMNSFKLKK